MVNRAYTLYADGRYCMSVRESVRESRLALLVFEGFIDVLSLSLWVEVKSEPRNEKGRSAVRNRISFAFEIMIDVSSVSTLGLTAGHLPPRMHLRSLTRPLLLLSVLSCRCHGTLGDNEQEIFSQSDEQHVNVEQPNDFRHINTLDVVRIA